MRILKKHRETGAFLPTVSGVLLKTSKNKQNKQNKLILIVCMIVILCMIMILCVSV